MRGKTITINGASDSELNNIIGYLLKQKQNFKYAIKMLYLPFVISSEDPNFRLIAIQCANQCQAWADSIREYAGLSLKDTVIQQPSIQSIDRSHNSVKYKEEIDNESIKDDYEDEDEDNDYEESMEKLGL